MTGNTESSVSTNLADLMRLEVERIETEREQERARREQQASESAQRAQTQADERERARREQQAELASKREAALLRARAEVEAQERLERERLMLDHERELARIRIAGARAIAAHGLGATLVIVVAAGLAYLLAFSPARRERPIAHEGPKHETAERGVAAPAPLPATPAPSSTDIVTVTPHPPPIEQAPTSAKRERPTPPLKSRPTPATRRTLKASHATVLDDFDEYDDDPLRGLGAAPRRKASR